MQSQSVQADLSLRTGFIVGFAMHRLMRELFVQTLTLSTLGTIFSRRHFEIFFSFLGGLVEGTLQKRGGRKICRGGNWSGVSGRSAVG